MNVYIAFDSDGFIIGIFSTREKAEVVSETVEEHEVK